MTNNDIIKKLRVALELRNSDIVHILSLVDFKATETELSAFFRAEDHPKYRPLGDQILRNFLNGLIIHKRGPMDPKDKNQGKDHGSKPGVLKARETTDSAPKPSSKPQMKGPKTSYTIQKGGPKGPKRPRITKDKP
ncbi:MAG: DUF1456 family protein [Bacteroidetes bacterium]|jgi:hypothetical protein|nr:DUF1456 family protein [Bacteroidota bacterium]